MLFHFDVFCSTEETGILCALVVVAEFIIIDYHVLASTYFYFFMLFMFQRIKIYTCYTKLHKIP